MQNKRLAYASTFVSFLLNRISDDILIINKIILYGSVAKGESTKESDVDIFIDIKKEDKKFAKNIDKILEAFYLSRDAAVFKNEGIDNKINIKIGKIEKWKELHRSIASTGILLWGKFEAMKKPIGTNHKIIFYWDNIEKNRGSFLNKLYGYKINDKKYTGLIEKWGGKKIGKSSIIIPIEYKEEMIVLIKGYGVNAKIMEVFALD